MDRDIQNLSESIELEFFRREPNIHEWIPWVMRVTMVKIEVKDLPSAHCDCDVSKVNHWTRVDSARLFFWTITTYCSS